jgi:glycosyltransferase involved in cell wall biosynthesis
MAPISYDDLRSGNETPLNRRAIAHFRSADIYIFHYPVHYPLFDAMTLVERGVVVVDYHGITPAHLWDQTTGREYERLIASQRQVRLVRYADYAIAHSSYARDELLSYASINPERVYIMPYVAETGVFRPGRRDAELAARYGLNGKEVLLYVGRMAGNKRIVDLVRALALIKERFSETVLLLVGDDQTLGYIHVVAEAKSEAARLGCADQVIFTGPVEHGELYRYYQSCDVYVTASLHEGFCIPVVEAMACGVPVVGTEATALPETIGQAGLTFRPEDPADLARNVLAILEARPGARPGMNAPGDRLPRSEEV